MYNRTNEEKIQWFNQSVYEPPHFHLCSEHKKPNILLCSVDNCPIKGQLQCQHCKHNHPRIDIRKIVPKLSFWILQHWNGIVQQDRQIVNQWRNTQINLQYCIDILESLKEQVCQREIQCKNKLLQLPIFTDICDIVKDMHNLSPQSLVNAFFSLNRKYGVFDAGSEVLKGQQVSEQRKARLKKNRKLTKQSKKFSEKALLFSEQLARIIEDKLVKQKKLENFKKPHLENIINLSDLKNKLDNVSQIGELMINLNQKSKKQDEQSLNAFLHNCQNLKLLHISNKNGNIQNSAWDSLTSEFQHLKNLRQLKLNLRAKDLNFLIQLFKKRPHSIRHITHLYLKITDEPKLDLTIVSEFCNCFQLRCLYLTLTRDDITLNSYITNLLGHLRVYTSLSQLPLSQFELNINKNMIINYQDRIKAEQIFLHKCKDIKQKQLLI